MVLVPRWFLGALWASAFGIVIVGLRVLAQQPPRGVSMGPEPWGKLVMDFWGLRPVPRKWWLATMETRQ